ARGGRRARPAVDERVDTEDRWRLLRRMSTERRYAIPVEQVEWPIPGAFDTVFRWEYEDARDSLVRLYEKAKNLQWNTNTRIDWSQDLDPENPQQLPDESVSIY